jgi:peptidoglycan/xylan/chitin deacetylase (PgdA/CDA1 family)
MSERQDAGHRRRGRKSRAPAVTILLLVLVAALGLSLALWYSPRQRTATGSTLGLGVSQYSHNGPGSYSALETEALSKSLPADSIDIHAPVLMYHYVDAEPPPAGKYADGLTVRTPDFTQEMEYLADQGYHAVTLADAYLAMSGLRVLPGKPVALTFDDGGLDNYEVAFPILVKYHLTATFFVITKTVGAAGQMSWDQLREMAEAGMSIQSHTVSHPDLPSASDSRLRSELGDSREAIRQALDRPVYALAYPAGSFDQRVIEAAKAAGYVMGVSTSKGQGLNRAALFEITRRRVQPFLPLANFARLLE